MKLDHEKTIQGKFFLHVKGFGFVQPEDGDFPEVFIPPRKNKNAISGDIVIAKVLTKSSKGYEGVIEEVVKRNRDEFVASVIDDEGSNYLLFSPLIGEDKEIYLPKKHQFNIGDRVTIKIEEFEGRVLQAKLIEFLGDISDTKIDVDTAIIAHNIRNEFSKDVISEAKQYKIEKVDYEGRIDLRDVETVTIDPTTARDYDDAITLSKDDNNHYLLGVHIADVSHFVKKGSALDKEAFLRSNSTYFPSRVVPMLPEQLSNNLCSLVEGQDRLTVSVLLEIDPEGNVVDKEISKTVIKSNKRFTYVEAYEILTTNKKSKHRKLLEDMQDLCHIFKKKRSERGSVELALPDTQVICDANEAPTHLVTHLYDITHQMIEEFMLKANEIVAETLLERGDEGVFRVHDEPDSTTLDQFYMFARLLGFYLPANPTPHDIAKLFQKAQDSPHTEQIAIKYIRSQKLAMYSPDNIGHYGLGLENYSHFTSPIRRYSDLVVHRILFGESYEKKELKAACDKCSENERKSFVAETSVIKLKKYRLLDKYFDEDPERIYEAKLTNVANKGLIFDVSPLNLEGFIPIRFLDDDYYQFNEKSLQLKGRNKGFCYNLGDTIKVQLAAIDLVFLESEWTLV
ncbi:MAG: Ribonuclease R [Chlamydiia bacterium]|nr:Ribonuclease R [Chlamydiia bacterium]